MVLAFSQQQELGVPHKRKASQMKLISTGGLNTIREDGQYDIKKIDGTWFLRSYPTTFPTVIASFKSYTEALTALVAIESDNTKVGA